MAVRIDGSGDILKRTASLPSLTNFTACGWLYTTAIQNYWGCVFGLENATTNAANQCLLTWNDSNPGKLGISVGGSNPIFTTSPSVGDWAFWAISCAGTGANQVTGYLLLPGATAFQTVQGTRSAFTPAQMSIGNDSYGDEFHNGRIDGLRVWDAVLTSDELYQEIWSKRAVRRASLHLETPMADRTLADNYIDISGNGKDLTAGGTLTVEDGSPAPWRQARPRVVYAPSAGPASYTLTAAQGSYTLTGQAAQLLESHRLGAAQGSYSLTGQSALLKRGYPLVAAQGAYSLAGQAATLRAARRIVAAQGAYALSGQAARLLFGRRAVAANGVYSLTGQVADLLYSGGAKILTAVAGNYALSGQPATLRIAHLLGATVGAYTLTGQAANLLRARRLGAVAGSFALTGQSAGLRYARRLNATVGAYALNGQPAALRVAYLIRLTAGIYVLAGQSATLTAGIVLPTAFLDEPLFVAFDSLETALQFDSLETELAFDSLESKLVFLTINGDEMFELRMIEGEVTPVRVTLKGRDPLTGAFVPHDLTGATAIKITVRKPDATPIINARDLTPIAPATDGRAQFTPTPAETAVGGKYKALVVATYPGSPDPIVRKFPGEAIIEDAIA